MKLIVANWKMNGSLELLRQCLESWQSKSLFHTGVLCAPFVFLPYAATLIRQPSFFLGGQDCHVEASGAFTGDTSAYHLSQIGCRYVIVGHSERRLYHHENNAMVHAKSQTALKAGLIPIICLGESLEQRQQGKTLEILSQQLSESLPITQAPLCIAYEPLWAIGSGKTPAPEDIQEVHAFLRQKIPQQTLLYGGSVTGQNGPSILKLANVDGVLVGGTSLKIDEFSSLLHQEEL